MSDKRKPLEALRHHVTGAIERGEAQAIIEQRAEPRITEATAKYADRDKLTKASDLRLGDHVILSGIGSAWNAAIVSHVDAKEVRIWRPYGTTADFSYGNGGGSASGSDVICYIGTEEFSVPRDGTFTCVVDRHTDLR